MARKKSITVHDTMQRGYRYTLVAPAGKQFDSGFTPDLSPKQMLHLGVFGGKYLNDCTKEFPASWFRGAKLSAKKNAELNFFGVDASLSLQEWQRKGWINPLDPRGWFQWYCRYYQGRRIPDEDARQIKRWRAMQRHVQAVRRHCHRGDVGCRRKQRQALLHWAYDSRKL